MKLPLNSNKLIRTEDLKYALCPHIKVTVSMLRLDLIDEYISGNKIFKLFYYIDLARNSDHKTIITFGGAYSNHLAATAKACKIHELSCVGIISGHQHPALSHTLKFCQEMGMVLEFVSRQQYSEKHLPYFSDNLLLKFGEHLLIPEGGFGTPGVEGAALISKYFNASAFTHICCPVGTGATIAGIKLGVPPETQLLGFTSIKDFEEIEEIPDRGHKKDNSNPVVLIRDYNFGGFGKKKTELLSFMNFFYKVFGIPTDFVYTAKMMYGVQDLLRQNYFPEGSSILCIHTGGLQGNLSLPDSSLCF